MVNIGLNIKRAIRENNITQLELSKSSGVPTTTISNYINNRRTPRIEILNKIAYALCKPISYFYEDSNNEQLRDECEILKNAIATWGTDLQLNVAIEELSELIKEICKNKRGAYNVDHIAEEVADVEIMLEQIKMIFNNRESVERHKYEKLIRLEQRVNDAKDDVLVYPECKE